MRLNSNKWYLYIIMISYLLSLAMPRISLATTCNAPELKILTYNIYMRPNQLFWFQNDLRAQLIPQKLHNVDVVVFQEAFDDSAREILINAMPKAFKYVSDILSEDRFPVQDGGVFIMSKSPIVATAQEVYTHSSGTDSLSNKGVLYVQIEKESPYGKHRFHIFGTHLNASDDGENISVQNHQIRQLRQFVQDQNIPKHEPTVIAGDFNIDPYADNYHIMLDALHANHLQLDNFTFDAVNNDLVNQQQKIFDHILFGNTSPPNISKSNIDIDKPKTSQPWYGGYIFPTKHFDLSDHFPVYANFCYDSLVAIPTP